jgi:hypothetical protein
LLNVVYARELPEELPGNDSYCPVMIVFRQGGEIGAEGKMLAKYREAPIGAINLIGCATGTGKIQMTKQQIQIL